MCWTYNQVEGSFWNCRNEIGVDAGDEDRVLVKIDEAYFRPTEVELLLGDPTRAKESFGWTATTSFDDLVKEMVAEDLKMVDGTIPDPERHRA